MKLGILKIIGVAGMVGFVGVGAVVLPQRPNRTISLDQGDTQSTAPIRQPSLTADFTAIIKIRQSD